MQSDSFSRHVNGLWVRPEVKNKCLRGTPHSHRVPWTSPLGPSNCQLPPGREFVSMTVVTGGGQEGISFWGLVRAGFPLKIKMFSELKCPHTESQSPNWAKAAHAWNYHISLLSAHWRPFIFPNFQGKLTSNFHISMAFTSVWMSFLLSLIILSLLLHSIMCWDLSQRSFLWESSPTHQN